MTKFSIDFFDEKKPWRWNPKELDLFLPGTQSWLLELCLGLKALGHLPTIWWDAPECEWGGIQFRDRRYFDGTSQIAVAWNHVNGLPPNLKADMTFLWTNAADLTPEEVNAVDGVICISEFQENMIRDHISRITGKKLNPNEITHCIYPGLNPEEFSPDEKVERDPLLAFYGSSWDRGLDRLLGCWPKIKREIPKLKLQISYNRAFMKRVTNQWYPIPREWKEQDIEFVALNRKDMGKLYRKASYLLYPCQGQEMFCLTAWKAQYAGCLPITTDYDALVETVYAGVKTNAPDWVNQAIRAIKSPRISAQYLSMRKEMHFPTWEEIAKEWEDLFSFHMDHVEKLTHARP